MALNLPLTFSVQFTKAVLRSSAIFHSSSLRYCLKFSAILRPNYFRYVWKPSLLYGMNCCMMLKLFSDFPFKFTLAPYKNACLENLVRDVLHEGSAVSSLPVLKVRARLFKTNDVVSYRFVKISKINISNIQFFSVEKM